MDRDILVRDTRIYVHTLARLLTAERLPLDYRRAAEALGRELDMLAPGAGASLDAAALAARARRLGEQAAGPESADPAAADRALMAG